MVVTSRTPEQARPERILKVSRGHWTTESRCHFVIDWNFDEDRSRIRTCPRPREYHLPATFRMWCYSVHL
jgi:predicted transposase YbfD/YdcC